MDQSKKYDVIIWGASGFTGRLVAEYIYNKYGVGQSVKWAMAGRNQSKLEKVRNEVADQTVPLVIADSNDEASLDEMVQQTKVVCTTVGPYAKYGSKLVASCVKYQVDYCDLTGEVQWMHRMINQHHEAAVANGTKIVHTCGFDSIPSDFGVYFIQQEAQDQFGQRAKKVSMRVRAFSGGFSGGTLDSLGNVLEEAQQDKSIYKVLLNPYGLNPEGEQSGPDRRDLMTVKYDKEIKRWIYPFIMAAINTKVVRRSNALMAYPYGKDFLYDEAMMGKDGFLGRLDAYTKAAVLGLLMAKPKSFTKKIINRFLPKAGEGPNKKQRDNGFYKINFYVTLEDGSKALAEVTGDKDPGYGSTCKMLAESAICLAKDQIPKVGGVITPSYAMGGALLKRLQKNAGLTFSLKKL